MNLKIFQPICFMRWVAVHTFVRTLFGTNILFGLRIFVVITCTFAALYRPAAVSHGTALAIPLAIPLAIAIFFAHGPDADFVPYLMIKKGWPVLLPVAAVVSGIAFAASFMTLLHLPVAAVVSGIAFAASFMTLCTVGFIGAAVEPLADLAPSGPLPHRDRLDGRPDHGRIAGGICRLLPAARDPADRHAFHA